MTSANVTEFNIIKKSTGKQVGHHRQHAMCKTNWTELMIKYTPIYEYLIQAYWYDEEDQYNEDEPEPLFDFLVRVGEINLK